MEAKFINRLSGTYELNEEVFVYHDGKNWKTISIKTVLINPLIYDKYLDLNGEIKDITLVFCPKTGYSIGLFGKYKIKDVDDTIVLDDNYKPAFDKKSDIRKLEIKLMILRNVYSKYPDCHYLDNGMVKTDKLRQKYGFLIEYISQKEEEKEEKEEKEEYKYTLLISKIDSLDETKNGLRNYLNVYLDKIREKGGMIIPVYQNAWLKLFPKIKQVKLVP